MATATDGLWTALHTTARVQSGNRIEITAPELKEGQDVDVFLIPRPPESPPPLRPRIPGFLASRPAECPHVG